MARTGAKTGPNRAGGSKRMSSSARAGLTFPLGRVRTKLKKTLGKGRRLTWGAAAYTTAVMEYLSAEVLEIAGNVARDFKVRRMTPRHILLAVHNDQELAQLLKDVTMPSSGVLPFIHQNLLPKGKQTATTSASTSPAATSASAKKRPAKAAKPKPVAAKKPAPVAKQASVQKAKGGSTLLNEKTLARSGVKLSVIQGDITDIACDALVNPTDSSFSLSGQVGSHLAKVGGPAFTQIVQKAVAAGKKIDTTEAVITEGAGFGASFVVHCNGPKWNQGNAAEAISQLQTTVQSCLNVADSKKLKSIAFPSIGSGVGKFPKQTAAETILRSLDAYFSETNKTTVKHVFFVLHDKESVDVYVTELAKLA
uniref:Macro domain-containing protein n=1 Tax=Plectus sambesii TaxID=2011161 RepID=A0A914UI17_9BILA